MTDSNRRKVRLYCGCFVGPPIWHGLDYFEPMECDWAAEVEVDADENGVPCGSCGAWLDFRDHEQMPDHNLPAFSQ